jgi:hypothetical protein
MLSVANKPFMMGVYMLNAAMLSVVAPITVNVKMSTAQPLLVLLVVFAMNFANVNGCI